MGMLNLKTVLSNYLTKVRAQISDDITDLLKIRFIGIFRARILKQNGLTNAEDIIALGIEKLKLICNFGEGNEAAVQRIWEGCVEAVA
jgi:hypothetical protein